MNGAIGKQHILMGKELEQVKEHVKLKSKKQLKKKEQVNQHIVKKYMCCTRHQHYNNRKIVNFLHELQLRLKH